MQRSDAWILGRDAKSSAGPLGDRCRDGRFARRSRWVHARGAPRNGAAAGAFAYVGIRSARSRRRADEGGAGARRQYRDPGGEHCPGPHCYRGGWGDDHVYDLGGGGEDILDAARRRRTKKDECTDGYVECMDSKVGDQPGNTWNETRCARCLKICVDDPNKSWPSQVQMWEGWVPCGRLGPAWQN